MLNNKELNEKIKAFLNAKEKLKIDDDTKVKYKLECLSGGIEVTQVSKENK